MADLKTLLRAGDPAKVEPGLAPAEVERMREIVLCAAREPARTIRARATGVAWACGLSAIVVAGVWLVRPPDRSEVGSTGSVLLVSQTGTSDTADRRQLLFAAPRGTRVIWVFDPDFDVRYAR